MLPVSTLTIEELECLFVMELFGLGSDHMLNMRN